MSLITATENRVFENCIRDFHVYLTLEKFLVEQCFDWLNVKLEGKILNGDGVLEIGKNSYFVMLKYSPFFSFRFDRIFIKDKSIQYNKDIHLYRDMSLCLYHPVIDKPLDGIIPLYKMLPWISEWCIFYEEWKKYGVWLGRQIEH